MMSIEEYRKLIISPKEEWEAVYNGKRCSIEALDSIIINSKGKGPDKKTYSHNATEPGPYYDPQGIHLHIWKNKNLIKNFIGEQNPNVKHIQYSDEKPGYYCSICHIRNKCGKFNWIQSPEKCIDIPNSITNETLEDINKFIKVKEIIPEKNNSNVILNWKKILSKAKHIIHNSKIEYKISLNKSIFLWPWELTPYQKFKLENPKYRELSNVFIDDKNKFKSNYVCIE